MANRDSEPVSNVIPGPGVRPVSRESKAYCGPAHGQQWPVAGAQPSAWVELPVGASSALYRLVRHRATGRPVRDHLGNYLYVPMAGRGPQTLIEQETQALISLDGGPGDSPGFPS